MLRLFDLLSLAPLSAIFQLYHGEQCQWWKKPERIADHGQATGKLYHLRLGVECTFFCNLKSRARTHAVLGMLCKCNIPSQNNKKKTNLKIANIGKDDLLQSIDTLIKSICNVLVNMIFLLRLLLPMLTASQQVEDSLRGYTQQLKKFKTMYVFRKLVILIERLTTMDRHSRLQSNFIRRKTILAFADS